MTSKPDIINCKSINVDVSGIVNIFIIAYKIVTALDDLKRKQMEKKKSSRKR